jgi:hypothetical protein
MGNNVGSTLSGINTQTYLSSERHCADANGTGIELICRVPNQYPRPVTGLPRNVNRWYPGAHMKPGRKPKPEAPSTWTKHFISLFTEYRVSYSRWQLKLPESDLLTWRQTNFARGLLSSPLIRTRNG